MRKVSKIPDTEEAKARARLLTHFIDNPETVFYSRQLEVLFEGEFFHWITNRALRALVHEGHVRSETRQLDIGSEMKLVWHRTFRFYKRAANEVFELVNRYTNSATDGTLGMQGEHLVLDERLPVMVWIYGGGYTNGSASMPPQWPIRFRV
jgi:hypothetical protein